MKVLPTKCTRRFWAPTLLLTAPFLCPYAGADSTGPHAPALVVSDSWTSPESAIVSDDVYANRTTFDINIERNTIQASGFGFSVPFGSTIHGVVATVERHSASGNPPSVSGGNLIEPGGTVPPGPGVFDNGAWANTDLIATLGAADSLWGASLSPAEINDPAFTVLYGILASSADTFFVDAITAEVFFDPPVLVEPCDTIARAIEDFSAFSTAFAEIGFVMVPA